MSRHRLSPLTDTRRPHCLTVSDMHGIRITSEAIPAGVDLREALRAALRQLAEEGWRAESDGAYGFVFVAKKGERRLVNLTPANTSRSFGAGHAFLAGRGVVTPPLA